MAIFCIRHCGLNLGCVISSLYSLKDGVENRKAKNYEKVRGLISELFENYITWKDQTAQRLILFVECREMASDFSFCMRREIPNAAVGKEVGEGGKESRIRQRGMGSCCKAMLTVEPPARNIQAREPVTHPAPVFSLRWHHIARLSTFVHHSRSWLFEILFHYKNNFLISIFVFFY